jgi:hypothetical protein
VRTEFWRLAKDDPLIAASMRAFRHKAYRYKEVGDYGFKPNELITIEIAGTAISVAVAFLEGLRKALG